MTPQQRLDAIRAAIERRYATSPSSGDLLMAEIERRDTEIERLRGVLAYWMRLADHRKCEGCDNPGEYVDEDGTEVCEGCSAPPPQLRLVEEG